ncbi:hypothetical protein B0H19DRAFT_1146526 [Mycena capillaripes]|nr:hypothetical protein B0H19DRAFT_1146526 [Mycena capillaripes]
MLTKLISSVILLLALTQGVVSTPSLAARVECGTDLPACTGNTRCCGSCCVELDSKLCCT